MDITQVIIIITINAMFVAMFLEFLHPAIIALVTLIFFFLLGYISSDEIMGAVSNEGVLTLALLFIIASVIERTNIIERVIYYALRKSKTEQGAHVKLITPIIGFSAFFNNTPIVVVLTPVIQKWCQERGLYASKLLIPLSYAAIFGGLFTIIGTSSTLIVHGWLLDKGLKGFSFFQMFPYTIMGVVLGVVFMQFIGQRLLPENKVKIEARYDEGREFLYEVVVNKNSVLIGRTVSSKKFKSLKSLSLVKIVRDKETISPVRQEDVIQEGDNLVFTGTLNSIKSLEEFDGLTIMANPEVFIDTLETEEFKLIEVIVSHESSYLHQKVKDSDFKNKYNASIIAVHRKGKRIEESLRDIVLEPEDVLLLYSGKGFESNAYENNDFHVLAEVPYKSLMSKKQTVVSISVFAVMVLLVTLGFLSMFEAGLICIGIFIVADLLDPDQVSRSVSFLVLLLMVSTLGIGTVLETSGTAEVISNTIIGLVAENFGKMGLIFVVYLLTNLLTELVTNAAAAVIVLPIALEVSTRLDIDPTLIAIVVAIAAGASFATPIGYQTNLIVYGPGGYKFSDYLKVGLPLTLIFMVAVLLSVYILNWVFI